MTLLETVREEVTFSVHDDIRNSFSYQSWFSKAFSMYLTNDQDLTIFNAREGVRQQVMEAGDEQLSNEQIGTS